ncbi:DUF2478 domain-containing protein [uncultured Cohaesibacter sp.]|uniref:DUF2478 domain-containing protein n=1 Tax=uncultured Cohaesibacter sp. TaxID=1002546 RepID=UPI00292DBF76|nr:DUF2478 domain-containing protein [uncultured Cohaesibacter sp.]
MKFAYVVSESGTVHVNQILSEMASRLIADGIKVTGTIQSETEKEGAEKCDMYISVLPDGPRIRVSQNLAGQSKSCYLDTSALEKAAGLAASRLGDADLLVINKYGKREAKGGGFRDVMAQAISLDTPIIVGVNALNLEAWLDFSQGAAVELEADVEALVAWAKESLARTQCL